MIPDAGGVADDVSGRCSPGICYGRSCVAHAAGLPRFCFWLGVGSGFCLAALALVISLGFRKN